MLTLLLTDAGDDEHSMHFRSEMLATAPVWRWQWCICQYMVRMFPVCLMKSRRCALAHSLP